MESRHTTKTLKIDKNKNIGKVLIIVEGEDNEFKLLKNIFKNLLDYSCKSYGRNGLLREEYSSKKNPNSKVIIANLQNSSAKFIEEGMSDELYRNIVAEFGDSLKNVRTYFLWDIDKKSGDLDVKEKCIKRYGNSLDNANGEINGLFLLSYPSIESYGISLFQRRTNLQSLRDGEEAKLKYNEVKKYKKVCQDHLLLAVENMNRVFLDFSIKQYDLDNFVDTNLKIFVAENNYNKEKDTYILLSLVTIILIDLGIIIPK